MLKLYKEVTTNRANRLYNNTSSPSMHNLYREMSSTLNTFIQFAFERGLCGENATKMSNELFNLSLKIVTNMLSSRFIDTRIMESMRDQNIKLLITSLALVISTVPTGESFLWYL